DDPPLGIDVLRVDDLRGGELALDLEDAAFDEALLVLGGLVLGVLGQVALGTRFGDGLDDGVALDVLQPAELFPKLFGTASGERDGGHSKNLDKKAKPPRETPAAAGQKSV